MAHINFGVHAIQWLQIVKKIYLNLLHFFYFLLNYTLLHLLESPHRGDSNGMPQCIVSWNGKENISNTAPVLAPFYLNLD